MSLFLYATYLNPSGFLSLITGIILSSIGIQMKSTPILSLGILGIFLPLMIILSLFAAGWGATEKQIQISLSISSSVIVTIAFLITRRF